MSSDYLYVTVGAPDANTLTCTVPATGGTSGTDGVYIPALDITSFSDAGVTVNSPTVGNTQIQSIKVYLSAAESTTFVLIMNGSQENGSGDDNALDTKYPPIIVWWDTSSGTSSQNASTKVTFSTTTNFNQCTISGGGIDTGGAAICRIDF
jgi:hypothetical protein